MLTWLTGILLALRSVVEARASREAEVLALGQQLLMLSRRHPRVRLRNIDRLILVWSYRPFPALLDTMLIVKPETVLRWHRRGFRAYWRWKSWRRGGRPRIDGELRTLIRRMSRENPTWGAPRIHGELLMLGIDVSESTVGRYMINTGRPRSQGWKTFPRNHAAGIASIDLFVVRTISLKLLYGLVILRHARRRLVRIAVTSNPAAERVAGQVTEAFPWNEAPRHLIRDRDGAFGPAYTRRAFVPWVSATTLLRRARLGRTDTSSGRSARFGANALITLWCHARHTCVTRLRLTLPTTTKSELSWRWIEMSRTGDAQKRSAPSWRYRFWVGSIINKFGFSLLTSCGAPNISSLLLCAHAEGRREESATRAWDSTRFDRDLRDIMTACQHRMVHLRM